MSMLTRRRVLAAKLETEVGTAIALDAAAATYNVFDAVLNPDLEFIERPGQSSLSPLPGVMGGRGGSVTFRTEWHGTGSAEDTGGESVPDWAEVFFPCCGLCCTALAKNVYNPVTGGPGVADYSPRTCTIGVYVDGTLRQLAGCMGNPVFHLEAGKIVYIEWTFTGVWQVPTTTALIAPTYPTVLPVRAVGLGLTLTEYATPKFNELVIDLGNEIILREDAAVGDAGYISACLVNRRITGTLDVEAVAAGQTSSHASWLISTEQAVSLAAGPGTDAGADVAIAIPKLQFTNMQEADRNGLVTNALEFQCNRSASAGDDELSITFT